MTSRSGPEAKGKKERVELYYILLSYSIASATMTKAELKSQDIGFGR